MRNRRFVVIALVILALTVLFAGCHPRYWMYDNIKYPTSSAGLDAARRGINSSLDGIESLSKPISNSVKVVIPNFQRVRDAGVVKRGRPTQEQIDYVATILHMGYLGMADALKKRNIFSQVNVSESYDTSNPSLGDENYLIWLYLTDQGGAQWYMKRKGMTDKMLIQIDLSKKYTAKILSWLNSVQDNISKADYVEGRNLESRIQESPKAASSGTGFVISSDGYILTAHHVVGECKYISTNLNEKEEVLKIIASDAQNDLALLKSEKPCQYFAILTTDPDIKIGEGVIAVGYSLSGLLAEQAQISTGVVSAIAGLRNDFRFLQITAPVQLGNSGGPLLDENGKVIGIVVAKLNATLIQKYTGDIPQNVNFAIKSSIAKLLLDAYKVNYITDTGRGSGRSDVKKGKSIKEISSEATKYTIKLQCWQ